VPDNSLVPWHVNHPPRDVCLRPGLNFHFGDTTDKETRHWHGEVHDRFRLILVLDGYLEIRFGHKTLILGRGSDAEPGPNMALVSLETTESFSRHAIAGNYCRRLSIGVSGEWLTHTFSSVQEERLLNKRWRHLDVAAWQASASSLMMAEEMLDISERPPELGGIVRESRALSLLLEAFGQCHKVNAEHQERFSCVQTPVPEKWMLFREWIISHAASALTIDYLAGHMSTTPSTLQRKFKVFFNETVFDCIHSARLELGMKKLLTGSQPITSIAMDVGYGCSASFCTAFKKQFGMTPSQARTRHAASLVMQP